MIPVLYHNAKMSGTRDLLRLGSFLHLRHAICRFDCWDVAGLDGFGQRH